MMQSDAVNWSVAILISLLVHSIILIGNGGRTGDINAVALQAPIITRLNFSQSQVDTVPDEPRSAEVKRARPLTKAESKPVPEKPAPEKPAESKPATRQQKSVEQTEPAKQAAVQQQIKGKPVSQSSESLLLEERQQYQHELMSHIESYKYYPRSARKRSLEGDVKVSLMLLDDGYYKQLMLDGEHSVLVKATRSAIESAAPFPVPPEDVALPWRLEFTMSYSLTH